MYYPETKMSLEEYVQEVSKCDFSKEWWSRISTLHHHFENLQTHLENKKKCKELNEEVVVLKKEYDTLKEKNPNETVDEFERIRLIDEIDKSEKKIRTCVSAIKELKTRIAEYEKDTDKNTNFPKVEDDILTQLKSIFTNTQPSPSYEHIDDELIKTDSFVQFKNFIKNKFDVVVEKIQIKEEPTEAVAAETPATPDTLPSVTDETVSYYVGSFMWGHISWYALTSIPWNNICFDGMLVFFFLVWCQNLNIHINGNLNKIESFKELLSFTDNFLQIKKITLTDFNERYSKRIYYTYSFFTDRVEKTLNGTYFNEISICLLLLFIFKFINPFLNFNHLLWIGCQLVCFNSIPKYNKKTVIKFLTFLRNINREVKNAIERHSLEQA